MYELETQTLEITEQTNVADSIVLLVNSLDCLNKKSYDINLVGASMYNWVVRACPSKPVLANFSEDQDLLSTIKPLLKNSEYTLVLYSDTPLITASGVNQILEFAKNKNLSVCRLARGWVFKTEYIKNAQTIYALNTYDVCANEMFVANSTENLIKATNILQARINKYHINNGVNILCPNNTYIECGVAIESGATIEPFAKLCGTTTIAKNCKICAYCEITDSKIDQDVIIKSGSKIASSAVLNNAIIGNNCIVINKSVVGEDSIVSANSLLDGSTTMQGAKIQTSCTLINTKVANNVTIGSCSKCVGTTVLDVKIGANATVGECCTIMGGVYLKADYTLPEGTVLNKKD